MKNTLGYLSIILLLLLLACHSVKDKKEAKNGDLKEALVGANKILVQRESEDIENYIRRHEWNMEETGTGLRIMIYKKGTGSKVQMGDAVKLNYKVNLIDGTQIYSSDEKGPLAFLTGRAEVINGLEEAILLMEQGDRAKAIIPSHLAYGLLGDEERIPKRATLIYDIELLAVKKIN